MLLLLFIVSLAEQPSVAAPDQAGRRASVVDVVVAVEAVLVVVVVAMAAVVESDHFAWFAALPPKEYRILVWQNSPVS